MNIRIHCLLNFKSGEITLMGTTFTFEKLDTLQKMWGAGIVVDIDGRVVMTTISHRFYEA